jgi:glutaredoxin
MKSTIHVLVGLLLCLACQSGINQTKEIIVYGSDNCNHCVNFKVKLDSVGFSYDFRDVEFNEIMNNEMVRKVRASGVQGGFKYPVVDIEGTILIAPEIQTVLDAM